MTTDVSIQYTYLRRFNSLRKDYELIVIGNEELEIKTTSYNMDAEKCYIEQVCLNLATS